MTPEREALVRQVAARGDGCNDPSCTAGRCAAAELLAELDALRAKVGAFESYLVLAHNNYKTMVLAGSTDTTSHNLLARVIDQARQLGLFEAGNA